MHFDMNMMYRIHLYTAYVMFRIFRYPDSRDCGGSSGGCTTGTAAGSHRSQEMPAT